MPIFYFKSVADGGEKRMKIKVKHAFKDTENDLKLRTEGEILEVSEKRAEFLVHMKAAERIDTEDNNSVSLIKTQN